MGSSPASPPSLASLASLASLLVLAALVQAAPVPVQRWSSSIGQGYYQNGNNLENNYVVNDRGNDDVDYYNYFNEEEEEQTYRVPSYQATNKKVIPLLAPPPNDSPPRKKGSPGGGGPPPASNPPPVNPNPKTKIPKLDPPPAVTPSTQKVKTTVVAAPPIVITQKKKTLEEEHAEHEAEHERNRPHTLSNPVPQHEHGSIGDSSTVRDARNHVSEFNQQTESLLPKQGGSTLQKVGDQATLAGKKLGYGGTSLVTNTVVSSGGNALQDAVNHPVKTALKGTAGALTVAAVVASHGTLAPVVAGALSGGAFGATTAVNLLDAKEQHEKGDKASLAVTTAKMAAGSLNMADPSGLASSVASNAVTAVSGSKSAGLWGGEKKERSDADVIAHNNEHHPPAAPPVEPPSMISRVQSQVTSNLTPQKKGGLLANMDSSDEYADHGFVSREDDDYWMDDEDYNEGEGGEFFEYETDVE